MEQRKNVHIEGQRNSSRIGLSQTNRHEWESSVPSSGKSGVSMHAGGEKWALNSWVLRRASQWDEIERFHNQDHHTTHVSRTFGEEQLGPIRSQSKVYRNGVGVFVCGTAS